MVQLLRALDALPEAPDSVPSTHMATRNSQGDSVPSSGLHWVLHTCCNQTYPQSNAHICKIKIRHLEIILCFLSNSVALLLNDLSIVTRL